MNNHLKKFKNEEIYSFLIALFPLLSIYYSGIPGINLGELLLILFLVFNLKKIKTSKRNLSLVFFILYVIIISFFSILILQENESYILIRMTRFIFYLLIVLLLTNNFFNLGKFRTYIKYIALFATLFLLLQIITYNSLGIHIKGFTSRLSLYTQRYETYDYQKTFDLYKFRPTSFFLEPAHYSLFSLLALITSLFDVPKNYKNIYLSLLITFGIVLSTSGQGLIFSFIIWMLYLLNFILKKNKSLVTYMLVILLIPILFYLIPKIYFSETVQMTMYRFSKVSNTSAVGARGQGYLSFINEQSEMLRLFGHGYGNTPLNVWFSGLAHILYSLGYFGLSLIFLLLIIKYRETNSDYIKSIIIFLLFISVSSETFNNHLLLIFFTIIYSKTSRENYYG